MIGKKGKTPFKTDHLRTKFNYASEKYMFMKIV